MGAKGKYNSIYIYEYIQFTKYRIVSYRIGIIDHGISIMDFPIFGVFCNFLKAEEASLHLSLCPWTSWNLMGHVSRLAVLPCRAMRRFLLRVRFIRRSYIFTAMFAAGTSVQVGPAICGKFQPSWSTTLIQLSLSCYIPMSAVLTPTPECFLIFFYCYFRHFDHLSSKPGGLWRLFVSF